MQQQAKPDTQICYCPEAQLSLAMLRHQDRKVAMKAKKSPSKERIHTLSAATVGSVAGFPEQLF